MPTAKARYQVTDTGGVQRALDRAADRWPEARDNRKELLLRLVRFADEHLDAEPRYDLEAELARHLGDWVAVRDDRVIFAAPSAGEVATWLRERRQRADQLFRVVDRETADAFGAHDVT
jgi:hypothetical protein